MDYKIILSPKAVSDLERSESDVKATQVEVQNIKEDIRELKTTEKWVIGVS